VIQLLKPGHAALEPVTLEEIRESPQTLRKALWIDLIHPATEEEHFVESTLGINVPSREEMHEIEASSRLFEERGALYLSCWLLSFESPIPVNSSVTLVITREQVISIRYSDHHAFRIFNATRNRLQNRQFQSSTQAAAELLEAMVGHIASNLRLIEQDLNGLANVIFAEQKAQKKSNQALGLKTVVQRLGKRNSLVASLRESAVSLSTLTSFFTTCADWLPPAIAGQLNTLERDILSLRQYNDELSEEISFLLDSTVGLINYEQNQTVKFLSIAAVLVALI